MLPNPSPNPPLSLALGIDLGTELGVCLRFLKWPTLIATELLNDVKMGYDAVPSFRLTQKKRDVKNKFEKGMSRGN